MYIYTYRVVYIYIYKCISMYDDYVGVGICIWKKRNCILHVYICTDGKVLHIYIYSYTGRAFLTCHIVPVLSLSLSLSLSVSICIYTNVYIYTFLCCNTRLFVYSYVSGEKEREGERERDISIYIYIGSRLKTRVVQGRAKERRGHETRKG